MIVFTDTSALFALIVRDDYMHIRAKANFDYFEKNDVHLLTSSYVILETIALLQRRVSMQAVSDFHIKIQPLLEIVWVDDEWHSRAMQSLLAQGNKNLSLVDCLSFEIMESKGITIAYTFDKHFIEKGFSVADFKTDT
jgi:predicted nucleic acid-binding protein